MWVGVCGMMDLGASPGQMSIIPDDTAAGGEVITQKFGVIDISMLTLLVFLICSEHLFLMPALSLAYKADIHIGGFVSGSRGVFKLQNYLLAFWHVLNCWSSEISTALVSSCIMPKYLLFQCAVKFPWGLKTSYISSCYVESSMGTSISNKNCSSVIKMCLHRYL